jgi:hypothetical protein
MAAPNLAAPTTITGKATYLTLANTTETDLLVNAASSGKALRVTLVTLANIDGTSSVDATVRIYNAASGGTGFALASTVTIPADATVVLLGRDSSVWLEEDRRLTVTASAGGDLAVVCSYEEAS